MSIWVEVRGTMKAEGLSVRRAINSYFTERVITQVEPEVIFSFTGSGLSGALDIDGFIDVLSSRFPDLKCDLSVTTRFLR